ncbi:hypothetical protein MRX96_007227 [Rhipicephalus microplus]
MHEERLASRVVMYTNGSVRTDGWAAAASFVPSLGLREKCWLPISASSTADELAAVDLTANQLAKILSWSAAVLCDSRAALLTIARGGHGTPIVRWLARKFAVIVRNGCDVLFQWVPSHVGLLGDETVNALAKVAHPSQRSAARAMLRISVLRTLHPHSRVAMGNPP